MPGRRKPGERCRGRLVLIRNSAVGWELSSAELNRGKVADDMQPPLFGKGGEIMQETIIRGLAQLATPKGKEARHGGAMQELEVISDAAIWVENGVIRAAGKETVVLQEAMKNDLIAPALKGGQAEGVTIIDGRGLCAVPGFIDPHTHFLFAGARAQEFDDRLAGVPYLTLLERGGGIVSTMRSTRGASEEALYAEGARTLRAMMALGVTTVEGKSGYGLDLETELRLLRVMHRLDRDLPTNVVVTYLGAHAVPPEYAGRGDDYVDFICREMLPLIQRDHLAEFVDVFCETGVFTVSQTRRIFEAARELGFFLKLHADEMSSTGGAELAAEVGAFSADHLLSVSEAGIASLAQSQTVAVLLPATAFCMRKPYAPARRLIEKGAAVALASDYNPGSCYTYSLPLVFALAVIDMQMTVAEALTAVTLNAAAAIGRADCLGSLEPGKRGDIVLLAAPDYRYLSYKTGLNLVRTILKDGIVVCGEVEV